MSHNYDNWEKLVVAVLRREELRALAYCQSMDTISSTISYGDQSFTNHTTFSWSSPSSILDDQRIQLPVDYSDLMTNHTDWKSLLPPDKNEIVWNSASLSFSLDKWSGKNCFMVGPRGLVGPVECVPYSKSRFSEVAQLDGLIDIRGKIEKQRLSPYTIYGAYLVFRLVNLSHDADTVDILVESNVDALLCERALESAIATFKFVGDDESDHDHEHEYASDDYYDALDDELDVDEEVDHTEQRTIRYKLKAVSRGDGWKEIEMGEFYIDDENQSGKVDARFVTYRLLELHSSQIHPIVEGIEFRPIVESADFSRPMSKISRLFGNFVWKTRKEKGRNL